MNSLFLLVPLAVLVVAAAAAALIWAIGNGQFDDLDRISRELPDDELDR